MHLVVVIPHNYLTLLFFWMVVDEVKASKRRSAPKRYNELNYWITWTWMNCKRIKV